MRDIFFVSREGNTVLSEEEKEGLRYHHITLMKELDEVEQANINKGLLWARSCRQQEVLTVDFAKKLHKKLFGEVWKWAGHFRVTDKNIGVEKWKIQSELKKLMEDTQYWIVHKIYPWPEMGARFHHRLVWIHPFPNGNGRYARIHTNILAERCQQSPPNWGAKIRPFDRRKQYLEALHKADHGSFEAIIQFLSI